jgi:hypothetical protein
VGGGEDRGGAASGVWEGVSFKIERWRFSGFLEGFEALEWR